MDCGSLCAGSNPAVGTKGDNMIKGGKLLKCTIGGVVIYDITRKTYKQKLDKFQTMRPDLGNWKAVKARKETKELIDIGNRAITFRINCPPFCGLCSCFHSPLEQCIII